MCCWCQKNVKTDKPSAQNRMIWL